MRERYLRAVMSLPVFHNHLLGRVDEFARGAFPRQSLVFSFRILETAIFCSRIVPQRHPIPLSVHLVSLFRPVRAPDRIVVEFFAGGRCGVAGDLPVRPRVHVVLQRGRCLDGRHDRDRD